MIGMAKAIASTKEIPKVSELEANIKISESFSVDAKIIGRVEKSQEKKLTLAKKYGTFEYPNQIKKY